MRFRVWHNHSRSGTSTSSTSNSQSSSPKKTYSHGYILPEVGQSTPEKARTSEMAMKRIKSSRSVPSTPRQRLPAYSREQEEFAL